MPTEKLTPLVLDATLDQWDRQPGETVKRYAQFTAYRDLGRARTLRKVAETLTLSAGYVRQVAAACHWVDRCEAWDRHRDLEQDAEWLAARRAAADNDAKLLNAAVGKVAQRLRQLQPDELDAGDLIRLLDVTLRHRRSLFGDPQMTVAVTGAGGDPIAVQLAAFDALPSEARRSRVLELADSVRRRAEATVDLVDDDE